MDEEPDVSNSLSSPSTEEESACPEFVSSYTQISYYNTDQTDDQTDVDSSDELSDESPAKTNSDLPQLSTQIVEWSKERFQSYNEELNILSSVCQTDQTDETDSNAINEKLGYFSVKILHDMETQSLLLAENLNFIMNYISDFSEKVTGNSIDLSKIYENCMNDTCDSVDSNIKLMYKIIAKCEEMNKQIDFIDNLRDKIKEIRQTIEVLERIV